MTIDIPEKLVARAEELGVPVIDLVSQALEGAQEAPLPRFVPLGPALGTPEEATAVIREIASRHTLGGLSIKALIEEGRR